MLIKGGYTLWARQTFDSEIFYNKPDKWFKIWFYIVSKVNHKDNKLFKRGENLITYSEITERTKATKTQIYKTIRWAKTERMIDTNKTTRGFIIKVLNYGIFQDSKNYTDDSKTTARRQQDDREVDTINNNDNNDNNDNNILINREEPSVDNLSGKVDKPVKGISNMAESLQFALDKMKIDKPVRNVPEWMRHALEVSDKLKIDWTHQELIKENIKPRWFSLFKKKQWGDLQGAYSFCYDYPNKPDSAGMVKLFFWKSGHKDINT